MTASNSKRQQVLSSNKQKITANEYQKAALRTAVIQQAKNRERISIQGTILSFPGLNDSSTENTGTPAVTGTPIVYALRSLILLYICTCTGTYSI